VFELTRDSTVDAVPKIDLALVNPVTGPVFIDGARESLPVGGRTVTESPSSARA